MNWKIKAPCLEEKIDSLKEALGVNKDMASLLLLRGVENFEQAKKFFRPSIKDLHDPYLMKDMDKAVKRILDGISKSELVMIYGDYDVDGITSVSMLYSFVEALHPKVIKYIPNRYSEGYGISKEGIDYAHNNDVSLIIALDCGIRSIEEIDYAKNLNIDFIICDHHLPKEQIPKATAVLNPKRTDCPYPYKDLCGCGVGFKLIQAISIEKKYPSEYLMNFMDLLVLAIAADIVPITGENRVLAYLGLQVLQKRERLGIKALISDFKRPLNISDIVFKLAPNINATGRLGNALDSVSLLLETCPHKAKKQADDIIKINLHRRELDTSATQEAQAQIIESRQQSVNATVVYNPHWNKGIVGIVASRLIEHYHRPTIVLTQSGNDIVGSGRSISGFDLHKAVNACSKHLTKFGGHHHAVGLSMNAGNLEAFKLDFNKYVDERLDKKLLIPEIKVDLELSVCDIDKKFLRILKQFAPFGPSNMNPIFYSKTVNAGNTARTVGKNNEHLSMHIINCHKLGNNIKAIGFGLGHLIDHVKDSKNFEVLYSVEENYWQGKTFTEFRIRDIRA